MFLLLYTHKYINSSGWHLKEKLMKTDEATVVTFYKYIDSLGICHDIWNTAFV